MNSREKAWHDKNAKPETIQDRMKKMKFLDPYSKKGKERSEKFANKYGRAWWLFSGIQIRNYKKYSQSWIMQFYIKEGDEK